MNLAEGILAVDVGSGTQDILVWRQDSTVENSPKMVLPSPTAILAQRIDEATRKKHAVFLSGTTMGGGPCSAAVRRHLKAGLPVFALREPALTFHDDLGKVERMGIQIVEKRPDIQPLTELQMGDIDLSAMRLALSSFHVKFPGTIAVAVQDHGFSPDQSNRAFRFTQWTELLRSHRGLETLLYRTPPAHMTRMLSIQKIVPGAWVMDTGPAAILGARLDPWVSARIPEGVIIVNAGNEHTVAALIKGEKIWGIYEHHTSLLDPSKLQDHLDRFRRGVLTNHEVFDEMGHGCSILSGAKEAGLFEHVSITGPNRERFGALNAHMAVPYGDMMLTGCFGLVEAVKRMAQRNDGRKLSGT